MAKQISIFDCFGGKRPAPRRLTPEASAAKKRCNDNVYDKGKRVRDFQPTWKEDRPWLKEVRGPDGVVTEIFCDYCRKNTYGKADPKCAFATGTQSIRIDGIKYHENSSKHKREEEARQAANKAPGTSKAEQMLKQMNEKQCQQVKLKFINIHALAKHNRPFSDFNWMNNLDRIKGLDVGAEYGSDKSAADFAYHIAEIEREKIVKRAEEAKFMSFIMDGSTDVSVIDQQMVYVRTSRGGEVFTDFVQLVATAKADADGITESLKVAVTEGLKQRFTKDGVGKKLVGMATDGAAVMIGSRNGVTSKVRRQVAPSLVAVHCYAHHLELAVKDVFKDQARYKDIEHLLHNIFTFYKKSNLNRSQLKTACKEAEVPKLVPTRIGGTRWLPHTLRALTNLWTIYPGVIRHLSKVKETGSATAKGKAADLLYKVTSRDVVEFGHFLWDLLITLSKLSLTLQKRNLSVAEVDVELEGAIAVLIKYGEEGTCPKLTKVQGHEEYRGVKLRNDHDREDNPDEEDIVDNQDEEDQDEIPTVRATTDTICAALVESLSGRFEMSDNIIQATSLANKKSWPSNLKNKAFGDRQIQVLLDHFGQVLIHAEVELDSVIPDWTKLKTTLYKRHPNDFSTMTWATINRMYGTLAPGFLKLVDLLRSIPATSVEAERGFSTLKLTKTEQRNRLESPSLNNLLRIKLLSPPEDAFDPMPAVNHWVSAAVRRKRETPAPQQQLSVEGADDEEAGPSGSGIQQQAADTANVQARVGLTGESDDVEVEEVTTEGDEGINDGEGGAGDSNSEEREEDGSQEIAEAEGAVDDYDDESAEVDEEESEDEDGVDYILYLSESDTDDDIDLEKEISRCDTLQF